MENANMQKRFHKKINSCELSNKNSKLFEKGIFIKPFTYAYKFSLSNYSAIYSE